METQSRKASLFILLAVSAYSTNQIKADSGGFDHSLYRQVLQRFVDDEGRVNYQDLKSNDAALKAYVEKLGNESPENHPELFSSRESQLAYWIDAYNALAIKGVVDHYPTRSVRDVKMFFGFFYRIYYTVGRHRYNLTYIENEIIRKRYQEPRVHFVLVCASVSCPKLQREPFVGEKLEEQLELAARFFINEERNVRLDLAKKRLWLSMIFAPGRWYETDFLTWLAGKSPRRKPVIEDYLRIYLSPERQRILNSNPGLSHRYFEYDWSLNEQHNARRIQP